MSTVYTPAWRDKVRAGAQSSAAVIAPMIVDRFAPATVVDIGAGEGWFCRELETLGVATTAVDGPWAEGCAHVDLASPPYPGLGRFDVALCLEVAEHLPATCAPDFVGWLTRLAPIVVFSAAQPGQGGEGHVNEQWADYWAEKFESHGYHGSGALRWEIWEDDRVSWWYRQSLCVFGEHGLPADGCPSVVHPGMWEHHGMSRRRR